MPKVTQSHSQRVLSQDSHSGRQAPKCELFPSLISTLCSFQTFNTSDLLQPVSVGCFFPIKELIQELPQTPIITSTHNCICVISLSSFPNNTPTIHTLSKPTLPFGHSDPRLLPRTLTQPLASLSYNPQFPLVYKGIIPMSIHCHSIQKITIF